MRLFHYLFSSSKIRTFDAQFFFHFFETQTHQSIQSKYIYFYCTFAAQIWENGVQIPDNEKLDLFLSTVPTRLMTSSRESQLNFCNGRRENSETDSVNADMHESGLTQRTYGQSRMNKH